MNQKELFEKLINQDGSFNYKEAYELLIDICSFLLYSITDKKYNHRIIENDLERTKYIVSVSSEVYMKILKRKIAYILSIFFNIVLFVLLLITLKYAIRWY